MDIMTYLRQQRDQIQREFDQLSDKYADMEQEMMVMRVEIEHLRGAYQRIADMEKELEADESVPTELPTDNS